LCVLCEPGTRRLLGLPCECCDSREQDASVIVVDTDVCARCGAVRRELAQCCCHRSCRGTPRVAAGFGVHVDERGTLLSPRLGVSCALEMGGGVCVEHFGAKSPCVEFSWRRALRLSLDSSHRAVGCDFFCNVADGCLTALPTPLAGSAF
jgi:hypothetical protein